MPKHICCPRYEGTRVCVSSYLVVKEEEIGSNVWKSEGDEKYSNEISAWLHTPQASHSVTAVMGTSSIFLICIFREVDGVHSGAIKKRSLVGSLHME